MSIRVKGYSDEPCKDCNQYTVMYRCLSCRPIEKNGKLTQFLYILVRDHLPTGIVEKILEDHVSGKRSEFSSKEVAALAKGWAKYLTED